MIPALGLLASEDGPLQASRILFALFLWVAAFHLHLAWRERKSGPAFWFGMVALCMALREWTECGWMPPGPAGWRLPLRAAWMGLFASSIVFIQFLWPFLDRPVTRFLRGYQAVLLGAMAMMLVIPTPAMNQLMRHFFWIEIPLLLMFPALLVQQVRAGHPEARTLAFGTLWLVLGSAHEVAYWLGFWPNANGVSWGFGLFMVSMAFSISNNFLRIRSESESLHRELEHRVVERTRALEQAQAHILRLSERASGLRDPLAWTQALEEELRPALGGARLAVWQWDGRAFLPIVSRGTPPEAELAQRLQAGFLEEGDRTSIPVTGPSGALIAVLLVEGKPGPWKDAERRMVAIFACHLAGALELAQLREELHQAAAQRAEERRALADEGSPALQVCPLCSRCFDHSQDLCSEDGSFLSFSRAFPYRVAARYRLTRFLGEGATAQVFEAEDERLGRRVAIKAIKPEHFHHANSRLRFEQEARSLAQLTHPAVLSIFDSGEMPDGTVYLVTERLVGASLGRVLQTFGPGRPEQVAQLLRDAGDALDAAHAAGLLHRDLKPDNIFVLPSPLRFKLLDFGLAKEVKVDSHLTQAGIVMGTPVYMSPEQIEGHDLDHRSDLYSLALVAWEALSGVRVVQGEALTEIFLQIVDGQPLTLQGYRPDLPLTVDGLFNQAFAKLPFHRPARCGAWATELANLLETCPSGIPGWPTDLGELPGSALTSSSLSGDQPTRPLSHPSEFP